MSSAEESARAIVMLATCLIVGSAANVVVAAEPVEKTELPPATEILRTLRPEHPRLLVTSAKEFAALRERIAADARLKKWAGQLRERAQHILVEPPSKYVIPDGLRLLDTSRRVLNRVSTLALLYQLDGDKRYVARAWSEMEAAANFPDWNPRHFLDTAEMTHAFAIGYDWLYDQWTPAQRATLRAAIVSKGFQPARGIYSGEVRGGWWAKANHNWNQVCNGGLAMGALAMGDEEPALAGEILHDAVQSLPLAMAEYAPDGAWAEGPGYWHYATSYTTTIIAALDTALGTDFGLSRTPGFEQTGQFPIYISGPFQRSFNFADGHEGTISAPELFWLARRFNRPDFARYERAVAVPGVLDLLWEDPHLDVSHIAEPPLDKLYRHVEVATMRSAWADRDALFVGVKAGDSKANHSHLDLGSFVLDALGVRWVSDLGSDDYNLHGYFGTGRWDFYRLRAEGHNTLVINPGKGPDQNPKAAARISRFDSQPARAFAITDLTPAYAAQAKRVERGFAMLDRQRVLVQDEVHTDKPAEIWWFCHTATKPTVAADGASVMLSQGKARLWARIVSPAGAQFTVMDAQPLPTSPQPERQGKNDNFRKLAIHMSDVTDLRLAILFVPLREGQSPPANVETVEPLADW